VAKIKTLLKMERCTWLSVLRPRLLKNWAPLT
jgi:hypothetical protein